MNNIAVITSIFGGKDNLREIKEKVDGIDYFCFSDQNFNSEIWTVVQNNGFSNRLEYKNRINAKVFKVLPFLFLPNFDYYIWIDGNHGSKGDLKKLISEMEDSGKPIALFKHSERSCVYQELDVCRQFAIDNQSYLNSQELFYKELGYPENNGLYELPCFSFKKTPQTINLMLSWWEQINMFSSRDQISLPFCLWKANIQPMIIPGIVNGPNQNNEYFIDYGAHNY